MHKFSTEQGTRQQPIHTIMFLSISNTDTTGQNSLQKIYNKTAQCRHAMGLRTLAIVNNGVWLQKKSTPQQLYSE